MRGNDIPYNPVFFSFIILTVNNVDDDGSNSNDLINYKIKLFCFENKISNEIKRNLEAQNILLEEYSNFYNEISKIKNINESNLILVDKNSCNYRIYDLLKTNDNVKQVDFNVIEHTKAVKNITELKGFKECHIRDGTSIIRYLAWLEYQLKNNKIVTEYEGALQLLKFRETNEHFVDLSFPTISSSGANAAIIHYNPDKFNCKNIELDKMYLLDSGAQYL